MIEIVCERENGENSKENVQVFQLPKNLRQIGIPPANKKIYIEDYVVTYLNYIAKPGNTEVRGAVLVGEKKTTDQGEAIFISGAVDAQNIEFDMNECSFTEEVWSEIYEDIKDNFPESSIVGWFLSRMGFSTAINDRIEKLHMDNFPGSDNVLYVTDSLESEDAFYMYEKGRLVKQKGYYIYYAKNENMQNYIISKRGDMDTEAKDEIRRKDSELLKSYREKNKKLKEERENNLGIGYAAGGFLALVVLAMGVSIASNYKKVQNMEVSINRLELTSDVTETNTAAEATIITQEELEKADLEAEVSIKDEANANDASSALGEEESVLMANDSAIQEDLSTDSADKTEDNDGEGTETSSLGTRVLYYEVRQGDTLTSIAFSYYGSVEYVDAIAEANSIGEEYVIYEGETIILPNVD